MKPMVDAAESMWDFRGDLNLEVDGGRFHPSYNSFSDIENLKKSRNEYWNNCPIFPNKCGILLPSDLINKGDFVLQCLCCDAD